MLGLTKKIDYALVALACLAERHGGPEQSASARQIGEKYGLPMPLLMNLLKELNKAEIVVSFRGPNGGYALATEPERISLMDVISALEGPVRLVQCADCPPSAPPDLVPRGREGSAAEVLGCPLTQVCPIRGPIRRLNERIRGFLEQTTLADLLESQVDVPTGCVRC